MSGLGRRQRGSPASLQLLRLGSLYSFVSGYWVVSSVSFLGSVYLPRFCFRSLYNFICFVLGVYSFICFVLGVYCFIFFVLRVCVTSSVSFWESVWLHLFRFRGFSLVSFVSGMFAA